MYDQELVVTRIFDAPRELVWKAWADPERFMRWWGPKDFTAPFCKSDFRIGGTYLNCMRSPEGQDSWRRGLYLDIVEAERIICTYSFADAAGNVLKPEDCGLSPDLPLVFQVTVTLEELEGKTTMTLRQVGIPPCELDERWEQGWNQAFDKLAESLK